MDDEFPFPPIEQPRFDDLYSMILHVSPITAMKMMYQVGQCIYAMINIMSIHASCFDTMVVVVAIATITITITLSQQTISTVSPLWRCSRMLNVECWVEYRLLSYYSFPQCTPSTVPLTTYTTDERLTTIIEEREDIDRKIGIHKCLPAAALLIRWWMVVTATTRTATGWFEAFVLRDFCLWMVTGITHYWYTFYWLVRSFVPFVRHLILFGWDKIDWRIYDTLSSLFPIVNTVHAQSYNTVCRLLLCHTVPNSLSTVLPIYLSTCHNDVLLDMDLTLTLTLTWYIPWGKWMSTGMMLWYSSIIDYACQR